MCCTSCRGLVLQLGRVWNNLWRMIRSITKNKHSECVNDSFHTLIYLPRVKFVKSKVSLTNSACFPQHPKDCTRKHFTVKSFLNIVVWKTYWPVLTKPLAVSNAFTLWYIICIIVMFNWMLNKSTLLMFIWWEVFIESRFISNLG